MGKSLCCTHNISALLTKSKNCTLPVCEHIVSLDMKAVTGKFSLWGVLAKKTPYPNYGYLSKTTYLRKTGKSKKSDK